MSEIKILRNGNEGILWKSSSEFPKTHKKNACKREQLFSNAAETLLKKVSLAVIFQWLSKNFLEKLLYNHIK